SCTESGAMVGSRTSIHGVRSRISVSDHKGERCLDAARPILRIGNVIAEDCLENCGWTTMATDNFVRCCRILMGPSQARCGLATEFSFSPTTRALEISTRATRTA